MLQPFDLSALTPAAAAATEGGGPINGHPYTLVMALVFMAIHLYAPYCRRWLAHREHRVYSLGGGMAVAYAILMLLPELERSHLHVGDAIHVVVLAGLVAFYAIEMRLHHHKARGADGESIPAAALHVGIGWIYTWAIIFAMPEQVVLHGHAALFTAIAIGVHLLYKDYLMSAHENGAYVLWGRYVLATAPLTAWVMGLIIEPSEHVADLIIAILAGYLLQNIFRNELPSVRSSRLGAFIAGAFLFGVPVTLLRML